jgi:streptogramin lyase
MVIATLGAVTSTATASAAPVGTITNFTGTGVSGPRAITAGPDGNVWFANYDNNSIGRITPGGVISNFTSAGIGGPQGITSGPDGNVWFTNSNNTSVGRITPAGAITMFSDPRVNDAFGITAGPDGNLWFANHDGQSIGRLTPAGAFTFFAVPGGYPWEITPGPDGNLWFTAYPGQVGRITMSGAVKVYAAGASPQSIVAGADGNLWFTDPGYGRIGRVTPTGQFQAFSDPSVNPIAGMAVVGDGSVWFGTPVGIGRVTLAGAISQFTDATVSSPYALTRSVDGNVWFANRDNNSIGMITTTEAIAGAISGTVTAGGAPVAGVVVSVVADWPAWTVGGTAVTDAAGSYQIPIGLAGSYRVKVFDPSGTYQRAWWSAGDPTYKSASSIALDGVTPTATADVSLTAAGGSLLGRAQLVGGAGLPGIHVRVFTSSAGYVTGATTGADGYYFVHGLAPGSYYVQFVDPTHAHPQQWFNGKALFFNAQTVTIGAGDTWASALMG